jgi:glycine hydroxymethyltransferase
MSFLSSTDPEVSRAIDCEMQRQKQIINLIASENYTSRAVLEAQGSFLNYKYAEGYPGKRYYGGCENMDAIETLAIERAKSLQGEHANVQPHSGSQAKWRVFFRSQVGDTIWSMNLGPRRPPDARSPSLHRPFLQLRHYVSQGEGRIDTRSGTPGLEHKPKLIVAGASAYPRIIDFEWFRRIADSVGARLMVDMAHIAGLVAAGLHPSPVPYADIVTTTTHKTLRGPSGGLILCRQELAKAIDAAVFPQTQGKPLMHAVAAKAVALLEAMKPDYVQYQKRIIENALALADAMKARGYRLFSGGTDNHLMLIDLENKNISGLQAEKILGKAGIVINRNAIPFDKRAPRDPGGMRLGTPGVTARGFNPDNMKQVAEFIDTVIASPEDAAVHESVRLRVAEFCREFPVPGIDD